MQKEINEIKIDIRDIRENHLVHIEADLIEISTNQKWIMKFFWIVATSSVAGLVAGIVNLII